MNFSKELRELYLMQQTYATLFSLANKIQIAGDQYYDQMTSRQYMTMLAILHLPEDKRTLNNIARKMGTTKQNVTQLVSNIEKKGYICIEPSKHDKRAVNVMLTESGMKAMLTCGEIGLTFMGDLFHDFSECELETLWDLLKKLYCFDGEQHDGFEEDVSIEITTPEDAKIRALQEFAKRRNKPATSGNRNRCSL